MKPTINMNVVFAINKLCEQVLIPKNSFNVCIFLYMLHFFSKDAFEGVVTELREELNAAQRDMITSMCEEISLERLDLLLEILFECIMLTITVPKGTDDDDVDMAKLP